MLPLIYFLIFCNIEGKYSLAVLFLHRIFSLFLSKKLFRDGVVDTTPNLCTYQSILNSLKKNIQDPESDPIYIKYYKGEQRVRGTR